MPIPVAKQVQIPMVNTVSRHWKSLRSEELWTDLTIEFERVARTDLI